MTTYKTIVRGLIKTRITNFMYRNKLGWPDGIRIEELTISEDKCLFSAYAVVINYATNRKFRITGEVFPSGNVVFAFVEVE